MRIITLAGYPDGGDTIIDRRAIWMTRPFDLEFQLVETCPPRSYRQDDCCDPDTTQASRRPDDCL